MKIIVPSKHFTNLLLALLPLASKDSKNPVLCWIKLDLWCGSLYATATDRHVAGIGRIDVSGDGETDGWTGLIDSDDVKPLVAQAKKFKGLVEVEANETALTVGGYSAALREGGYPKVGAIISKALETDMDLKTPIGLNPTLVGKFAAASKLLCDGMPAEFWAGGPRSLLVMTCGPDFVGAIMPTRTALTDDTRRGQAGNGLESFLQTT